MSSSGRKLGGGRVLGSGRSLCPAVPVALKLPPSHQSNLNLNLAVSPSESSVSLSSQISTPPSTQENQDLSSRVSLDHGARFVAAAQVAASDKLVCPICDEEMVTLLQLNRHLDDTHSSLPPPEANEIKTWFRTSLLRAKQFQPLSVLNQKLKGLDSFESNAHSPSLVPQSTAALVDPPTATLAIDPAELVTRTHWQRHAESCSDPLCPRKLFHPLTHIAINCRCCGKLFCEDHTMYQMRLSRSAVHEPVRGAWCRVCETCYKSRTGYNDHNGLLRDHIKYFEEKRKRMVEKRLLEVGRLEKRLTKLTQLLVNPPRETQEQAAGATGLLWALTAPRLTTTARKQLEQSVVSWEDDGSVSKCPFCKQDFASPGYVYLGGSGGVRRHHCRLCGRVVCGDPRTECSSEVALDVSASASSIDTGLSEKSASATDQIPMNIRMCSDCNDTLFSRLALRDSLANPPPSVRSYTTLLQFQSGILTLLPKFQSLLHTLTPHRSHPKHPPPTPSQLTEATRLRKRLMDAFTQYNLAATRLRDLPTTSTTQRKLQKAVYNRARTFLSIHMLPLRALPGILKHPQPPPTYPRIESNSTSLPDGRSETSSPSTETEEKERQLREEMVVLEEQRYLVEEMQRDAARRRKFDEVAMLAESRDELGRELVRVRAEMESRGLEADGVRTPRGW